MTDVTVDNGTGTDYDVSMGAGAVNADKTQRVTLASDDPAVTALGTLLTDTELRATPVPVSGTVDLGATDNAVLDAIAASLNTLDNVVAGSEAQVDIVSMPAITGTVDLGATDNAVLDAIAASVAAIDTDTSTIIGHVDGIESVLGTIDADTGNIATAVQLLDDSVVVLGTDTYTEATSKGLVVGAVRRDADTTLANTTNEYTPLQVDANGRLKVEAFSGETLPVSLASLPASTNTIEVVGDAAHDAALAGNPVRIGARGVSADPAVITTGRTVDLLASLLGKQIVLPYCHPGASETYASSAAVTDTADDEVFAAVASTRHYITGIQVFNGHDSTGTEVVIKDGSTVKWRGWAEEKGGGCSAQFNPPLRGTANTAVNVANITNSSSTYFNVQGYQATE